MRVQFDLRPATMLERERKKTTFNATRLVAFILMIVFVVSNSFYLWVAFQNMMRLNDAIEEKEYLVNDLESGKNALEAEVGRLRRQEADYAATLKIMQDDLPTLEVLEALEKGLQTGMGLNTLRFNTTPQGATAMVDATAATDEQTVQFSSSLTGSGVFSAVTMPSSKLDDRTKRVSFTMSLTLLPIGQIKKQ
ncbi:MAG: hypothetical protein LBD04_03920 [Synergistaceae bacterium]|jgi:hypothetical protein|nr:hypothetical protein [Synergistaceae bacterium]